MTAEMTQRYMHMHYEHISRGILYMVMLLFTGSCNNSVILLLCTFRLSRKHGMWLVLRRELLL